MLAPLQCQLSLSLADRTLQSQHDLLRCFGFFMENWFGLTSVTGLFTVVTALPLRKEGGLLNFASIS
jgi:hypothetical protein